MAGAPEGRGEASSAEAGPSAPLSGKEAFRHAGVGRERRVFLKEKRPSAMPGWGGAASRRGGETVCGAVAPWQEW